VNMGITTILRMPARPMDTMALNGLVAGSLSAQVRGITEAGAEGPMAAAGTTDVAGTTAATDFMDVADTDVKGTDAAATGTASPVAAIAVAGREVATAVADPEAVVATAVADRVAVARMAADRMAADTGKKL
jgi:trimeric autotransporter adhesin